MLSTFVCVVFCVCVSVCVSMGMSVYGHNRVRVCVCVCVRAGRLIKSRLNNRDFHIDQNNRDYDFPHNQAALVCVCVRVGTLVCVYIGAHASCVGFSACLYMYLWCPEHHNDDPYG